MSRYEVSLTLPEVEELDDPEHTPLTAVEHFIHDVQNGARQYVYLVRDEVTGDRWHVDLADGTTTPLGRS